MGNDSGVLTLAKQGSITFIGNIANKLLGFLFIMVVTRLVSQSVYGLFTLGVAIVSFSQGVFSLNLSRSIDYFLPKYLREGNQDRATSTLITVLIAGGLSATIGYVILVASGPLLSTAFEEPDIERILPLIGIAVPLLSLEQTLVTTYSGIKQLKFRVYTKNIVNPVIKLGGAAVLVSLGAGIWGLVWAYVLAILASVVVGGYLLLNSQKWLQHGHLQRTNFRKLLEYSLPLMFAGVIYGTISQIDYFVIGYFMETADVASYRVGYALAGNLLIVLSAITPVFKPMISEQSDKPAALRNQYRLATRWITLATIPIAITLVAAPELYLSLFFTAEYAAASTAFTILVAGFLVNAAFGPEGMVLEGLGYTRLTLLNTVALLATNAVIDVTLVPAVGIHGAAIGTGVGLTVAGVLGVTEIWYLKGFHPLSLNLAKLWVAAVPALAFAVFVASRLGSGLPLAITLPPAVIVVYATSIVIVCGFTDDDYRVAQTIDEYLGINILTAVVSVGKS